MAAALVAGLAAVAEEQKPSKEPELIKDKPELKDYLSLGAKVTVVLEDGSALMVEYGVVRGKKGTHDGMRRMA